MSVSDHYWRIVDIVARDDRRALQVGLFVSLTWLVIVNSVVIVGVEQNWLAVRQVAPLPWWVAPTVVGVSFIASVVAYLGLSKLVAVLDEELDMKTNR